MGSAHSSSSQDMFSHWTWDHRYREDGLVLDPEALLPLAARYACSRVPGPGVAEAERGESWDRVQPFSPLTNTYRSIQS